MSNLEENDIVNKIKEFQDDYYSKNKKNIFFKKNQKLECATQVCSAFPLEYLISQTLYIIPNTNKIFFDYVVFKLFANKDNYSQIVDSIFVLLKQSFETFDNFELYMNIDSFTVSAFERYKEVLIEFINKCVLYKTSFADNMKCLYLCNVPKTIDLIIKTFKPFMEKQVYNKLSFCDENTSIETIKLFHSYRDKDCI